MVATYVRVRARVQAVGVAKVLSLSYLLKHTKEF